MAYIRVIVSAINRVYQEDGRVSPTADPTVRGVLRGLARIGQRRQRQVRALPARHVVRVLERLDEEAAKPGRRTIATRDAAIIAVGFAAALRRSEICALRIPDIEFRGPKGGPGAGMVLYIQRSKTDPQGEGQTVAVPDGELIRPVARLQTWLRLSRIRNSAVFQTLRRHGHLQGRPMHPTDIGRLIKRRVRAVGLDPADYSGHSLRAGFVTSAAESGARIDKIMEVTRHRSPRMVLRYVRQADAFQDHAGRGFL